MEIQSSWGKLFCFEGLDGSGKSTQIRRLSARLTAAEIPHALFRSPGASPLADELRLLLKRKDCEPGDPAAEALLHMAAIVDGFKTSVLPALCEGRVVILDRFVFSTAAYQGVSSPALRDRVTELARAWLDLSLLTRVFLLDVPPQRALHRMALRTGEVDRYDQLPLDVKEAVRANYLAIAQDNSQLVMIVDGDRPPTAIEEEIWLEVTAQIGGSL